ncbi:MAG: YwiC-like family protein [Cyanobacteria bacterium P01_F01_bin.4]
MIATFNPATHLSVQKPWYLPTVSPEHGVLLVLAGALLTGASLAQSWTWETTLACLGAFFGLQAEHPLVVQIKQRRQWKPRYVFWAGMYGGAAIAIAAWLTYQHSVLIWVCVGAAVAMGLDVWAVFQRRQKAIDVEIVMFAAICLATLFVYGATTGMLTSQAVGLWLLNTLFFASAVFTIKLRKVKTSSLKGGLIYHASAISIVTGIYALGWLSLLTALTFTVALLKLAVVVWQRDWYCNCRFEYIARFETYFALSYTALVCLTVLPARLPPPV